MKLIKAQVTNFRSAEDSEPFSIERVTCLVGKNEAGKSAILLALAALNPHASTPVLLDKERDYPRRFLTQYADRHGGKEAVVVRTVWELNSKELGAIKAELGEGVVKSPNIEVSRAYHAQEPQWDIDLDLGKAIENALASVKFEDAQLAALKASENTQGLIAKLGSIPSPTPEQTELLARIKGYGTFTGRVTSIVAQFLPKFMYFSTYDRMDGAVRLEQLQQWVANGEISRDDRSGARLFMEFLEYAGAPVDEILNVSTYETFNAKLQGASNNITDQILEYWTQNPDLSVVVTVGPAKPGDQPPFNEGTIGRARIYNALHRVDTPFSERSAGFVWFFSFLVKFAQVKKGGQPIILLLDEPGLTLHGKAQGDLLRYFNEKLAPHHQIIYSTHSPFMVSADKLTSARIVEDKVETKGVRRVSIGTKVSEDVLSSDPDTIFPLQGALGYEITQTLFIGKHSLLVEGVSDILYLQALSGALKANKRVGLDPRWTLCPTGGIGNVRAFMSLFGGNNLDILVLADSTKKDRNKIEEIRRSEILKAGRVLTFSDFTGKIESDVEDLFEPSLFARIVNAAYRLSQPNELTPESLEAADVTTTRLVKKAEAAFRVLKDGTPTYDHFTPADWLIRNSGILDVSDAAVAATLDRAEDLFTTVNESLMG